MLHVEPIPCGQEDATDVVVESCLRLVMSFSIFLKSSVTNKNHGSFLETRDANFLDFHFCGRDALISFQPSTVVTHASELL